MLACEMFEFLFNISSKIEWFYCSKVFNLIFFILSDFEIEGHCFQTYARKMEEEEHHKI